MNAPEWMRPVFVIGNPRSGTTMLRLVLMAHSRISIPPECGFIVGLFPRHGHVRRFTPARLARFLEDLGGRAIDLGERWEVPLQSLVGDREKFLDRSYAEACAELYLAYPRAKGLAPATIWGDKNNAHGNYIDVLASLYPAARFVHIVRDGRAVLTSYKALRVDPAQKYAPRLPKDTATVAAHWVDMVDRIDRHLARYAAGRHTTLRYEDILTHFDERIGALCGFLGLNYEPGMRQFDEQNVRHGLEPEHFGWKANTRKPLDPSRAGAWQRELSRDDIAVFEALAGDVLERYGYELTTRPAQRSLSLRFRVQARLRETLRGARRRAVRARGQLGA